VGWIVCWKQGVEKSMKIATTYETDIANLHGPIGVPWIWPPQGMSIRRILDCKLFAEDVVVGHRDRKGAGKGQRNLSVLVEVWGDDVAPLMSAVNPSVRSRDASNFDASSKL
jgi:hypothetical protein